MRIAFKKRAKGQIEFGIIYGSIALLLIGAARLLPVFSIVPSCIFKGISGIPCPTCGSTRSVVYLSQGDFAAAFAMNPLTSLGLVVVVSYFFYSFIALLLDLPRASFILTGHEKNVVRAMVIMLFLAQWAYLIATR